MFSRYNIKSYISIILIFVYTNEYSFGWKWLENFFTDVINFILGFLI